jgi:hypothetical protein
MARKVDIKGLLRFRDSKSEPRTEQTKEQNRTSLPMASRAHIELSPFQRVKLAADCFLAAELLPVGRAVN